MKPNATPDSLRISCRLLTLVSLAASISFLPFSPAKGEESASTPLEISLKAEKKAPSLKKQMDGLAKDIRSGSKKAKKKDHRAIVKIGKKLVRNTSKSWRNKNALKAKTSAKFFRALSGAEKNLAPLNSSTRKKLKREINSWRKQLALISVEVIKFQQSKLKKADNREARKSLRYLRKARKAHKKGDYAQVYKFSGEAMKLANKALSDPVSPLKGLILTANRTSGSPGTVFEFTLKGWKSKKGETLSWDFDNGTTESNTTNTQVTYDQAGYYAVTATVANSSGSVLGEDSVMVAVVDPLNPVDLMGNPLPGIPGDVNGDGTLSLVDALMIRQHLSSVKLLVDPDQVVRADMDQDSTITEDDAELLAQTILTGNLPSSIQPATGMPGTPFTVRSAHLLDPDAEFALRLGTNAPIPVAPLILGEVTEVMPLDVLTPGSFTKDGGTLLVELLVNGEVRDAFTFTVLPSGEVNTQEILASLEALPGNTRELVAETNQRIFELASYPEAAGMGFDAEAVAMFQAVLDEVEKSQSNLVAILLGAVQKASPVQQEAFARTLVAAGLPDLQKQLVALSANPSPMSAAASRYAAAGPGVLATLCTIQDAATALDWSKTVLSWTVAGLTGGAIVAIALPEPILDGPVLAAWATATAKYLVTVETAKTLFDILPKPGTKLQMKAGKSTLAPGESTQVEAILPISIVEEFCKVKFSERAGGFKGYIIRKVIMKYFKTGSGLKNLGRLKRVFESGTDALIKHLTAVVDTVAGPIVGGAEKAIQDFSVRICQYLDSKIGGLTVEPTLVGLTVSPNSGLTYSPNADGWTFTCPDPPPSGNDPYTITGSLSLCGKTVTGETKITCGNAKGVTITMGDNGSATDDIFEVSVDGVSVLTSSSPVTSISKTLDLLPGSYTLVMRGLAAPDGIGTYFISVTGGSLQGGPPLSGRDLTAGAVFTWTLVVSP